MPRSVLLEPGQDPNAVIAALRRRPGISLQSGWLSWLAYGLGAAACVFSIWWMFFRQPAASAAPASTATSGPTATISAEIPATVIPTATPSPTASRTPIPTLTLPAVVQTLAAWRQAAGTPRPPVASPTSAAPYPAAASSTPRMAPTQGVRIIYMDVTRVVEVTRVIEVTRAMPATVIVLITAPPSTAAPSATPAPSNTPTSTPSPTLTPSKVHQVYIPFWR